MKTYKVPVKYIIKGTYYINAESREKAEQYAKNRCGLTLGGHIHSTLPDEGVDWEFVMTPEEKIGKARRKRV